MAAALESEWSQRAISVVGTVTSSVVGGASGSFSGAASMAAMNGQPIFSSETALSTVTGAVGGIGGGMLESGSYLGIMNKNIIPVPLKANELHLINEADNEQQVDVRPNLLHVLVPQEQANSTAKLFANDPRASQRLKPGKGGTTYDTVAVHGAGNTVFPTTSYRGYMRPIKGKLFAEHLRKANFHASSGRTGPIKMMVCFGAWSNAQVLADALERDVYASYSVVYPAADNTNWKTFTPKH
jgi:hypothetical protein